MPIILILDSACRGINLRRSCENGGYQDPTNCARCRCPTGYGGDFCTENAPSVRANCGGVINLDQCSSTVITSPSYPNSYPSGSSCSWVVKSVSNHSFYYSLPQALLNNIIFNRAEVWYTLLIDSQTCLAAMKTLALISLKFVPLVTLLLTPSSSAAVAKAVAVLLKLISAKPPSISTLSVDSQNQDSASMFTQPAVEQQQQV